MRLAVHSKRATPPTSSPRQVAIANQSKLSSQYKRHLVDAFQYKVAAIASLYVLCQVSPMIECLLKAIGIEPSVWLTTLNTTVFIINSTFKLPLLLLFSKEMRKTSLHILLDIGTCKKPFPEMKMSRSCPGARNDTPQ